MRTELTLITERAKRKPKDKWISLYHLLNEGILEDCFYELKKDKAVGVDGVTVKEYEKNLKENIKNLVERLKRKKYRPQPSRRTYIPKDKNSKRPLGIPTTEDKIVEMGIKKILEIIYEEEFLDVSYGFRPKRSCHQALEKLDKCIMTKPINYVVDMDIEKFFDTVSHEWLMKALEQKIADKNLLKLIGRFLKAGIMEEGKYIETDKGTPQGGIISPILANIYLHYILDLWFETKVKREVKGYAELIRFADDFIVCFQYEEDARKFSEMLRSRVGKYGLKVSEEKSKIIEFGRKAWNKAEKEGNKVETFDFLGFTHYCDKTRKGNFKLGRKTSRKKFWQKVKAMNEWIKGIRNLLPLKEWWRILGIKIRGHYNYYGISGNMKSLKEFYTEAVKLGYKWINRRSQRKSYTLEKFYRFLEFNPLPIPKIYHLTYTLYS